MKRILMISIFFFIAGCSPNYMKTATTRPEIKPIDGKSVLVIVRGTNFGKLNKITNYLDGEFIGQTYGKSYITKDIEPGSRYVMAKAENVATARLDFQPGKVYYLLQAIYPGVWTARTGFVPKTPEQAHRDIKNCKFLIQDPTTKVTPLPTAEFKEAAAKFEKETKTDYERHREVLEYKGY